MRTFLQIDTPLNSYKRAIILLATPGEGNFRLFDIFVIINEIRLNVLAFFSLGIRRYSFSYLIFQLI